MDRKDGRFFQSPHPLIRMFVHESYHRGPYTVLRLRNEQGGYVDIIPEIGGMVHQIALDCGNDEVREILECDSGHELRCNPLFRGRILFPFNDRIPGGKYHYKGKEYRLPINDVRDGSAKHGLVYNRRFSEEVLKTYADKAEVYLSHSIRKGELEGYPFAVTLELHYTIGRSYFLCNFKITNDDCCPIPVAFGWHPYFVLNKSVDCVQCQVNADRFVPVKNDLIPTGEILPVNRTEFDFTASKPFGHREVDITLCSRNNSEVVLKDGRTSLKIQWSSSFIQLYIPAERTSVSIEPVTAATNSFNIDGLGRMDLSPGEDTEGTILLRMEQNSVS